MIEHIVTAWRRFRHRLYRDRPGWRRSPWAGGDRYWYEPDDGWPQGPITVARERPPSPSENGSDRA